MKLKNLLSNWQTHWVSKLISRITKSSLFLFQSSSSTESDSLPFANENAGTIRTRAGGAAARQTEFSSPKPPRGGAPNAAGLPPHPSPTPARQQSANIVGAPSARQQRAEPADVLNDIGNMLANLTDELDAMLEEEKRQQ